MPFHKACREYYAPPVLNRAFVGSGGQAGWSHQRIGPDHSHHHGDVVIAAVNGELTCKVLDTRLGRLLSGNDDFPPTPCTGDTELVVEGVVIAPFSSLIYELIQK